MNPLAKAVGTVLVLAAGTLGTALDNDLLPDIPGFPTQPASGDAVGGNSTGNETGDSNETAPDGGSGNGTAGPDGNETGNAGNATGNETDDGGQTAGGGSGNETAGNETAEPEVPEDTSVCDFFIDEWGGDLTPQHHEWEWLVTRDVTRLTVQFQGYGGLPGLGSHPEARLADGSGRTIAHTSGTDGSLTVDLHRGTDYLAGGTWRLTYDSDDLWSDYYVQVYLGCAGSE